MFTKFDFANILVPVHRPHTALNKTISILHKATNISYKVLYYQALWHKMRIRRRRDFRIFTYICTLIIHILRKQIKQPYAPNALLNIPFLGVPVLVCHLFAAYP